MIIKSADFTISNTKISKLPVPELPEYAFMEQENFDIDPFKSIERSAGYMKYNL
jgi:hypothetical protein